MSKQAQHQALINLLNKIKPATPETEMVSVLQEIITTVGTMRYRLRDMPLITGALNLLISSAVLDHEEKEEASYEDSTALKTIVDLALE
jgi:hypothetical protein